MTRPCYQHTLGVEPPIGVLWAALAGGLTPEQFAAVEAAYRAQSRRYQRACKLNKLHRWADTLTQREPILSEKRRADLERIRAMLADPMKYVEGTSKEQGYGLVLEPQRRAGQR